MSSTNPQISNPDSNPRTRGGSEQAVNLDSENLSTSSLQSLEKRIAHLIQEDLSPWQSIDFSDGLAFSRELEDGILVLQSAGVESDCVAQLYRYPSVVSESLPSVEESRGEVFNHAFEKLIKYKALLEFVAQVTTNTSPFSWEVLPHDYEANNQAPKALKAIQAVVGEHTFSLAKEALHVEEGSDQQSSSYSLYVEGVDGDRTVLSSSKLAPYFEHLDSQQGLFEQAMEAVTAFSVLDWSLSTGGRPADDCLIYTQEVEGVPGLQIERSLKNEQDEFVLRDLQSSTEFSHPDFEEVFDTVHDSFQQRSKAPEGVLSEIVSLRIAGKACWTKVEELQEGEEIIHFSAPVSEGRIAVAKHEVSPGEFTYTLQLIVAESSPLSHLAHKPYRCEEAKQLFLTLEAENQRKLDVIEGLIAKHVTPDYERAPKSMGQLEHFSFGLEQDAYRVAKYFSEAQGKEIYFVSYDARGSQVDNSIFNNMFASRQAEEIFKKLVDKRDQ